MALAARLHLVLLATSLAGAAHAGVHTDDLSRCILEATSENDRTELVRWMFAAASTHPAVKPLASVSPQQLGAANQEMADLVVRLLTVDCRDTAKKAFRYEGTGALSTSMQLLGQVAGRELFAHPDVAGAMADLEKRFDQAELEAQLTGE